MVFLTDNHKITFVVLRNRTHICIFFSSVTVATPFTGNWQQGSVRGAVQGKWFGFELVREMLILVDVVRQPAEALAVALFFEHRAHEKLDRARVQFVYSWCVLAGCRHLEKVSQLLFRTRPRLVDLVAENQDWNVCYLLVCQQLIKFRLKKTVVR